MYNKSEDLLKGRTLLGVDLGATNIRVARIFESNIEQFESAAIVKSEDPGDLLHQIEQLIKKVESPEVESIGLGVPSVVDIKRGIVYNVQNIPAWKEVPVKSIFEKRLGRPVHVNNDANCFVVGEKYFGKGRGYHTMAGLTLGSGFGSGLILEGNLYSGENCGAGEVGMLPYRDSIFEHYCSGMFFEREFNITGGEVFKQARNGDRDAKAAFEEFGTHLGNGIKAVLYAYDPQLIILGGSVRHAWKFFREAMFEALADFAYPKTLENIEIVVSEFDNVSVLGAAALGLAGKHAHPE